jgi:hypothetical protein
MIPENFTLRHFSPQLRASLFVQGTYTFASGDKKGNGARMAAGTFLAEPFL